MINADQLRSKFENQLKLLPSLITEKLRIDFNVGNPLYGIVDIVIYNGDDCMALGFFQDSVRKGDTIERRKQFSSRFKRAMGYHEYSWYFFGFDGNDFVINDLSFCNPIDEFPDSLDAGIRRLCTLPKQWHAEKKILEDMQQYLEAIRDMISEESFSKNVN